MQNQGAASLTVGRVIEADTVLWDVLNKRVEKETKMSSTFLIVFLLSSMIAFVASDDVFCPKPRDNSCPLKYKINDCCAQSDCPSYGACCVEPCGNVCQYRNDKQEGKTFVDGTKCTEGHVYPSFWENVFG